MRDVLLRTAGHVRVAVGQDVALFLRITLLVLAGDLASKQLAVWVLAGDIPSVAAPGATIRLALVHNPLSAFSISLGDYTWSVNVAVTLLVVLLAVPVCRELAAVDSLAPCALGLISGAALGNLVSLFTSPGGVVDFMAVDYGGGRELVANVADLAAYVGVVLMLRICGALGRQWRSERERESRLRTGRHRDTSHPAPRNTPALDLAPVRLPEVLYAGWIVQPAKPPR